MHLANVPKYCPRWDLFILCISLLLILPAGLSAATEKKVLILHSYHQTTDWTESIMEGMTDILDHSGMKLEIYVEYLDSDRTFSKISPDTLDGFYREKYQKISFDLILSSNNDALAFLMARRDHLFPGVPIFFCGVINFKKEMIQGRTGITGVNEEVDIKGTIDLALRLRPDIKRFLVISDRTPTGQANRKIYEEAIKSFRRKVPSFELMDDFTSAELQERLQGLPRDSAVLVLRVCQTRDAIQLSPQEYVKKITAACDVPVFYLWTTGTDVNVLAGVVVTGKTQGASAASGGLRILKGEDVDSLPVIMKSPNVTMVDFRQLKRFGIPKEPGIGTGLGLSVSYMIITQNHRGIMEAMSPPGQGACFSVRLPLSKEDIHEGSLHRSGD